MALAENFGSDLSVARIDLLEAGLADLSLEQIHTAFKLCALRRERFFPSLAELRGYVDGGTKHTAAVIEDELAWQQVLEHCRIHVWRDGGRTGPRLSDAIEFAVRCSGGWFYIEECSERDLVFAKQRFIDALGRWRDGTENFAQLPDGPTKNLIAGMAEQKQLPAGETWKRARAAGESYRRQASEYTATVSERDAAEERAPTPIVVTEARLELLEKQKQELLAKATPEQIRTAERLRGLAAHEARG